VRKASSKLTIEGSAVEGLITTFRISDDTGQLDLSTKWRSGERQNQKACYELQGQTPARRDERETLGWKNSLGLRLGRARGFYLIVGGATLIGSLGAMSAVNPITMLVWSAVVNGIVAVPLMVGMMMIITNRAIMGQFAASRVLATFGWLATLLMGLVVAALLLTTVTG
jgi:Natural resistance-associated macrophage protein